MRGYSLGRKLRRIPKHRVSRKSHVGDMVTLTLRMLRPGRLALMASASAAANTFVIEKLDGHKLRKIWSGGQLSRTAKTPDMPPLQCTPSALSNLEASVDLPVPMSSHDGRVFFDQLSVPRALAAWLGRPPVRLADLLDPPQCESGGESATGITDAELKSLVWDGPLPDGIVWLTPISTTWPLVFA